MTRNLAEYPITINEKLSLLRRYQVEAVNEELVGDLRPLILQQVIELIRSTYFKNEEPGE